MGSEKASLIDHLAGLYRDALAVEPDAYLEIQASGNAITRHVEAFLRYAPDLPEAGSFLDWGCHHAPDSCLIRHRCGDGVDLHGCDFEWSESFRPFHERAGLRFERLADRVRLPYGDGQFDVVVGSGVLEHVALDLESLKELYRVLRDDGLLVITFLPNRGSLTEWCCRRLGWSHHLRLYGRREIARMLLHHGFQPIRVGYHQFVPAHKMQGVFGPLYRLNGVLERAWPLNALSANVFVAARKRGVM